MIPEQVSSETWSEQWQLLWQNAWDIWSKGGWAMGAIAINALILFGFGTHILIRIVGKRYRGVSEQTWRIWIEYPKHREGKLGRMLNIVTRPSNLEDSAAAFDGLRQTELAPIDRDLKIMRVCIAAAPLLGLLGTVMGMLSTFDALRLHKLVNADVIDSIKRSCSVSIIILPLSPISTSSATSFRSWSPRPC